MRRIFGTKKPEAPKKAPVDMDAHSQKMDGRMQAMDTQIAGLNRELKGYQAQLKKTRNPAQQRSIKQRAMLALKRKKQLEKQRDGLGQRMYNFEGMKGHIDMAKDTREHVDAMSEMAGALREEYKEIDVDKVEDMADDIEDVLADAEDIQELMGRDFTMGEDVDEADLDAELAGLEDELFDDEGEDIGDDIGTTSFLPPTPATGDPIAAGGGAGGGGAGRVPAAEPVAEPAYGFPEPPTTA
mmetsp:Transcript_27245/g.94373  ORF Transcript_27245/g.94373 Transcript_27245/m.94373 type:complete len:241 (-) Transcript_27245:59-781(-)